MYRYLLWDKRGELANKHMDTRVEVGEEVWPGETTLEIDSIKMAIKSISAEIALGKDTRGGGEGPP